LTDDNFLKLTKRDPNTGAEIKSTRETAYGYSNSGNTYIYGMKADLTSTSDGGFYIVGINEKSGYRDGNPRGFIIKFTSNLEFAWYRRDDQSALSANYAVGVEIGSTHVYASLNFCSALLILCSGRAHQFYRMPKDGSSVQARQAKFTNGNDATLRCQPHLQTGESALIGICSVKSGGKATIIFYGMDSDDLGDKKVYMKDGDSHGDDYLESYMDANNRIYAIS